MAAKNNITGDEIKSRYLSSEGRKNWDRIFAQKPAKKEFDDEICYPSYDQDRIKQLEKQLADCIAVNVSLKTRQHLAKHKQNELIQAAREIFLFPDNPATPKLRKVIESLDNEAQEHAPAAPTKTNKTAGADFITQLVNHLIYGDIEEMPLSILGDNCPDPDYYNGLDREQQTRLAAAATVLAWSQGRLHPSGFLLSDT
jgi:hypothetical protein